MKSAQHARAQRLRTLGWGALVVSSLIVSATAWPLDAAAQDRPGGKGRPAKRSGDGGRMRMGDGDPAPEEEQPTPDEQGAPTVQKKSEPELLVERLADWPALEAKRASVRLAAQPSVAFPLLRDRLLQPGQDWRMVSGVAATLGKIGDLRAIELIEAKLQDRTLFLHSHALLDALIRIDPVGAKQRLLAQLLHPASAVVEEARKRLETRIATVDVATLRDVLDAGGASAREAAIALLVAADPAAARADLIAALRDKSPGVAMTAALGLASDASDGVVAAIRKATLAPVERQVAYAYLALGLRGSRTRQLVLDESDVRFLIGGKGLSNLEMLSQSVAAIVLADAAYHHDVPGLGDELEERVVPALLEVVAGRQYWKDQKYMEPLARERLQRLSGEFGLQTSPEWVGWWDRAKAEFRARRILVSVSEAATSRLVVQLTSPDTGVERTTFVASASSLVAPVPGQRQVLLDTETAARLAQSINVSGILSTPEGRTGPMISRGPVELSIRAGDRERRVRLDPSITGAEVRALLDELHGLRKHFAWQRYRPADRLVELREFVDTTAPLFAAERSQEDRDAALGALIIAALSNDRGDRWNREALDELFALESVRLSDADSDRLLSVLGSRGGLDEVAEGIVLVLARSQRDDVFPILLDFLVEKPSVRSNALFATTLQHATEEQQRSTFEDERVVVRIAALRSLTEGSLGGNTKSVLVKAVKDPVSEVRMEAYKALGRTRTEDAREELERVAAEPSPYRTAAIEGLGYLGGKDSLPTLMVAFSSNDPGVRISALQALGETREPEGLSALVFAMGADPQPLVREMASRALMKIGTDRAADELRKLAIDPAQPSGPRARAVRGMAALSGRRIASDLRRLVEDPARDVADEAALALSRWRDPAAAQHLIDMMRAGRAPARARHGLESISLEEFSSQDFLFLADIYEGWWGEKQEKSPRQWLYEALLLRGKDDQALYNWSEGKAGRGAVPILLETLRADEWYIRRAADLALREILGQKVGDQDPWTPAGEVRKMAEAWEGIWADLAGR